MNAERQEHWVSTDTPRASIQSARRRSVCEKPFAIISGYLSIAVLATSVLLFFAGASSLSISAVWKSSRSLASWFSEADPPPATHRRDFAEITTGAQVVLALTSPSITVERVSWFRHHALSLLSGCDFDGSRQLSSAQQVFRERDEYDGTCWMFAGKHGSIAVLLSESTSPTSIVLHQPIHHQLSERTASQAARQVVVWGLPDPEQDQRAPPEHNQNTSGLERFTALGYGTSLPRSISREAQLIKLGEFEFAKNSGVSRQVFPMHTTHLVEMVVVEVMDNWGAERTCVHRISIN
ncbi:hypothetical protein BDZ89DRAFT_1144869 [Hymenopellis radicata]|nr:hypothetical protein BDZ89DRAFT_1144869 [Hymenopellis radicata]